MSRDKNQQARTKGIAYSELPVEPLPDLSWQRVERNIMAELARSQPAGQEHAPAMQAPRGGARSGRRRAALFGAGALGLAAAAAIALLVVHARQGTAVDGGSAGGSSAAAQAQAEPGRTPSRIVTGTSPSAVSLGDVALDVAPKSAVLVDDGRDRGVLVVLERGRVHCRVAPRNGRPPVVINAGDARVEVIGTEFAVSRIGDTAKVDVYHGVVKVVQHGRVSRVPAGQSWSGLTAEHMEADAETAAERQATASRQEEPAHADREREPGADRRDAPRHSAGGRGHRSPSRGGRDQATPAPTTTPSARERYDQAARLEASDPAASLATYRDLAASGGAWAPNALFAEGRLELDLGHRSRARALLESYLHRYPRGPNAQDARSLLDRIEQDGTP